jgi:hypothetical protein
MHPNDDFLSAPELDYDSFRAAMREDWGWFSPARETNIFASKVRTRRVFGFAAVDLTCNATRLERTELDIRRDNMEYYYVTVQDTGESTIIHNDQVVNITAGDVVLLDSTRPVTFISPAQDSAQWLGLQVPRQNLASHLGFEPQGGACGRRQAQAARLLCQLALDPVSDTEPACALLPPQRQAVQARLRHHQGPLCRSGHLPVGSGCRDGNFAALFAEAVHGPRVDIHSLHIFASSGSCGASDRASRVDEDRSASQRYRLRLRLSRLHVFCARIPPAFRRRAGRRRSSASPVTTTHEPAADISQHRKALDEAM